MPLCSPLPRGEGEPESGVGAGYEIQEIYRELCTFSKGTLKTSSHLFYFCRAPWIREGKAFPTFSPHRDLQ